MKKLHFHSIVCVLLLAMCSPTGAQTIRQKMDSLAAAHDVSFVYDAQLPLGVQAPAVGHGLTLQKALSALFARSPISYRVQGRQVLLIKQKKHTLSGYVRDKQGETLINATVFDLTTRQGTMTNEYGHFSITLPEGTHELQVTYVGHNKLTRQIELLQDQTVDFSLSTNLQLRELVVSTDLNSPVFGTQMGKHSLSQADIKTEFSLFSSPDVVKTLQRLSGVQEGIELASGLYVHGGNGDENLFLLDGTPLYNVNHSLGLFSSFNADMLKNVDFYKSGFPARYGGRLSSVVDVRTNDGNWQQLHGSYRIGLLDGSVQLDGPIKLKSERAREARGEVRGVDFGTSFNIGLRRSWLDLFTRPIFALVNSGNEEEKISVDYAFHDLNAKLTHIFSQRSQLSLSLYSGADALSTNDEWREKRDGQLYNLDIIGNKFRWGNVNAALNWRYLLSPKLHANFTAVYTRNRANLDMKDDDRYYDLSGNESSITFAQHNYHSTINDLGYRTEFDFRPSPSHHMRFGHDYTRHLFRPQTQSQLHLWGDEEATDTLRSNSHNRHKANELSLYGEDLLTLDSHWSLNGGVNLSLFNISGKTFVNADPRLAVKYQPLPSLSLKASYTQMTQYVHKISNAFLELPSDYWVPTTERLRPMYSRQVAIGAYWQPLSQLTLSAEGYYKFTRHLLQFSSWAGLEPPAATWDTQVTDGCGRFYGVEADAQYRSKRLLATLAYTLSWNERRFDEFYPEWYYDKFDNRHKLNLALRYKCSKKTQVYAAWTFHTGNHMTFPTQYIEMPTLPDQHPQPQLPAYFNPYQMDYGPEKRFIYEQPNNITLPAYHRLDLGFDFHHTTKHGHERIWNLSVYNAYCHLNTLWNDIEYKPLEGNKVDLAGHQMFRIKTRGYIPIIPSFSYTIKF